MVIVGFRNPIVSLFYVVSLAFVAFHLSHGIGSLFQTVGITDQRLRRFYERGARILAWVLFVGYVSIPVSILFLGLGSGVTK